MVSELVDISYKSIEKLKNLMLLEVLLLNKEKLKISESSLGLLDLLKHKSLILGIFIFL